MQRWVTFPWSRLRVGQGFFIPCLDTAKMIEWAQRDLLQHRHMKVQAAVGIQGGLYGVWFFRV